MSPSYGYSKNCNVKGVIMTLVILALHLLLHYL